jgi:hypothetical protein
MIAAFGSGATFSSDLFAQPLAPGDMRAQQFLEFGKQLLRQRCVVPVSLQRGNDLALPCDRLFGLCDMAFSLSKMLLRQGRLH